ncbi:LacI family transcriptional regulator [Paenibacillus kribbensis]|uniref:LacI family transcriptional regulator n=2 Tax=Paenibacillus kribbensis TaxID=172713 RepID=A0A222WJ50_9BACL|nr:LacI family transcriptional regulator [Paenibacillus kribbensis]
MENQFMKMEDIAQMANVSKSAVSLAFSGKPGISPETREHILQIAHQVGYMPKSRASHQKKGDKALLFLVCTSSGIVFEQYDQQPFFKSLIYFIEENCRQKGYKLIFSTVNVEFFEEEIKHVFEEKYSDGAIVLGTNLTRWQIEEIHHIMPNLVVLDTCFDTLPVQFIGINNRIGAYQAGAHLCQLGHTSIGYIASNVRIHNFEERQRGFMEALEEFQIDIPTSRRLSVAPTILSSQESLKKQLTEYLSDDRQLPTAWFCECDYIAISAIKTLTEMGIKVPEECSVIGFDNINESLIITPELTTIHVEKERMAELAVDLLTRAIETGPKMQSKITVDTRFVERKSCAPPSPRDLNN